MDKAEFERKYGKVKMCRCGAYYFKGDNFCSYCGRKVKRFCRIKKKPHGGFFETLKSQVKKRSKGNGQ